MPCPPLEGKELEDQKWIAVSTEHFQVRSTLGKRKTIKLVRELDLMRLAVPLLTNIERIESAIPTHIYAVKRAADFDIFGIDPNYVDIFRSRLRNNSILIRNTPNMDEAVIVLHEYVYFLLRNHSGLAYPR